MKRWKHSLSYPKVFSFNMGTLTPIGITEVLPGDSFQHNTSALLRVSPLLAPVMTPVHVRIHHWFVPNRLVWEDWEDFITGGADNEDASVFPTMTTGAGGVSESSLAAYLGIPSGAGTENESFSALPIRACQLIWNEWYRDQDLESELAIDLGSGPDTTTPMALQSVAWEKDYFTTARPWAQKGPDISIPVSSEANIIRRDNAPTWLAKTADAQTVPADNPLRTSSGNVATTGAGAVNVSLDPNGGLYADIAPVMGSLQDLRVASALLRYGEARAFYGSRYTEYLRYLGVRSSDARLQRPEYLGGGKQTIQFSEVLQTAPEDDVNPVGALKGHGISSVRSNRYRRFFEEHGHVISFISVKPKTIYFQGLNRMWNRRTKEDFYQRELVHVGQQEIPNKELYLAHTSPEDTFGWQDRYSEYRQGFGGVAGDFRGDLNYWHMAREFGSAPTLNAAFVRSNPTTRIYADQSSDHDKLWCMAFNSIQARRIVPPGGGVGRLF